MRKFLALLLPVVLVGCQGGDATPLANAGTVPTKPVVAKVDAPNLPLNSTAIQLLNGSASVTVGMTEKAAFRVFPPVHEGDKGTEQMPEGLSVPYQAKTWETAGRGFGVILYDDTVVAAMYQEEQISDEALNKLIDEHQSKLGVLSPKEVTGERVNYRFWELNDQRLMICSYKNGAVSDVTIAMGVDKVMDALGASPEQAETAVKKIAELLNPPKTSAPSTANP